MNYKEFLKWTKKNNINFEFYTEGDSGVNGKMYFYKGNDKHNCLGTAFNNPKTNWNSIKEELKNMIK
jgi:hypothetical protein